MKKKPLPGSFEEERPYSYAIHRRAIFAFAVSALLFSLLYLRIAYLVKSPELMQTAKQQSKYTLSVSTTRGGIYDCRMRPLVNNTSETVYAVLPSAQNLAPVLESVPVARRTEISAQLKSGKPFLLRGGASIQAPGVTSFHVERRSENRQLAPHIIGYTDDAGNGVTGIEKSFNDLLSASAAEQKAVYTLDGLGHSIPGIDPEIRQTEGGTAGVVLSIDENIQKVVENAGSRGLPKGAIVVMDPFSGELKAVASFPSYTRETLAQSVKDSENTPMINRAFLNFSVGSTFKVVTAAAALEAKLPIEETYICTGQINVSGQIFRCHNRSGQGEVDMMDALMKSCNPYFIQLGLKVGADRLLEMTKRFGFGSSISFAPGMGSPGGSLPTLRELQSPAAVANLSFGQGVLLASPVQVTRMMAVACNGGMLVTPKLVLGTTGDGKSLMRSADVPSTQILSTEIAAQLQSFLIHSVMVEEGQNALPDNNTAGGKTATAQTGRFDAEGNEYEHGWFSGFFPAANPRYVITVLSENSGFGNTTAAPVFAEIAEQLTSHGW